MSTATVIPTSGSTTRRYAGPSPLVASLAVVGAASIAVLRLLMPYDTVDGPAAIVHKVYADPGAQSLLLWLAFGSALTLVPGVLAIGRWVRTGAPRLTAVAMTLLVAGYLALPTLDGTDLLPWLGQHSGTREATVATMAATSHPTTTAASIVFVVGHVLGTMLLGIAMWRSRSVPRWAAVATTIAQPLHFVSAVVITSHPLDFAAWLLNAAGYAAATVAIARNRSRH